MVHDVYHYCGISVVTVMEKQYLIIKAQSTQDAGTQCEQMEPVVVNRSVHT